ncbi:MAG: MOSC N-terminal beta barrel domain-containing protein, partial [Myxococcota bacterium]|nr:MOSC N-terminal beta barrel domain-containing protein [Myxococcota bacterium]
SVDHFSLDHRGPVGDRRWMVTEPGGGFLTQREHPRMATVRPRVTDAGITLSAPGMPSLQVPTTRSVAPLEVRVWKSGCVAADQGDAAAGWFSELLDRECRFVWMPDEVSRPISGGGQEAITFADGYPILVCHEASLEELNRHLETPVTMNRFRANVVVRGGAAWDEDRWARLTGDEVELEMAKPCERCKVITVDQETGVGGKEPLRTLASFERDVEGVCFGQNAIHRATRSLRVGQTLKAHPKG